jgi:hypothetical protein
MPNDGLVCLSGVALKKRLDEFLRGRGFGHILRMETQLEDHTRLKSKPRARLHQNTTDSAISPSNVFAYHLIFLMDSYGHKELQRLERNFYWLRELGVLASQKFIQKAARWSIRLMYSRNGADGRPKTRT